LFEDLHAYYLPSAAECGLEFECTVDEEVPDIIFVSAEILQQILGNLLSNAFKFTQEGSVQIQARLDRQDLEPDYADIAFFVQDTGIGISDTEQQRIFDAFSQVDESPTRKYGGVGLGLTVSRRMLELLGSTLEMNSTPEQGTTFFFTIKAKVQKKAIQPAEKPVGVTSTLPELDSETPDVPEKVLTVTGKEVNGQTAVKTGSAPKILLVEDNKVNRLMMVTSLTRIGCEVTEAVNGLQALEVLGFDGDNTGPVNFDLVMMDIQMPEMDGMEATRHIRKKQTEGRSVPIVAVTAHTMGGDQEIFTDAGMDDYLPKPVNSSTLMAMLEKHLGPRLPKKA
jgi:CheY-like chemotaxis protein